MEKKYEITSESKIVKGVTVYRIKALRTFADIKEGSLGGFIQSEANLAHNGDCWIGGEACAFHNAFIGENALLTDEAMAFEQAKIMGDARVRGKAQVFSRGAVHGLSLIKGDAWIHGGASVFGCVLVTGCIY